jgi:alpha-tubulin suppressor-like RCC1 family protein
MPSILAACSSSTAEPPLQDDGGGAPRDATAPPGDASVDADASADASVPAKRAIAKLSLGWTHSCLLLTPERGLRCWGDNGLGALGVATNENIVPEFVRPALDNIVDVEALSQQTCAVVGDGTLRCWGSMITVLPDLPGLPQDQIARTPLAVPTVGDIARIAGQCLLHRSRRVSCFGNRYIAFAGDFVHVPDIDDAVDLAASPSIACIARGDGRVRCWGSNVVDGPLFGLGRVERGPVEAPGIDDAIQVTVGPYHACALRRGGRVVCWGSGLAGTLGNGSEEDSVEPVEVRGLADARQIASGLSHVCALRAGGTVVCWGSNRSGGLGLTKETEISLVPVPVPGLTDAVRVFATPDSSSKSCAEVADGRIFCWGAHTAGSGGADGSDWGPRPLPSPFTPHDGGA